MSTLIEKVILAGGAEHELLEAGRVSFHSPLVLHGSGWPLDKHTHGGWFLYHGDNQQAVVGLIMDLSYQNPWLSPFVEFQRMKHHPVLKQHLEGGTRVAYGARAIAKGGLNCLPKMTFPGGLLIGCDAGTLNFAKIKGTHTAMKSGMIAAECLFKALGDGRANDELSEFGPAFQESWAYKELHAARNVRPSFKWGLWGGTLYTGIDQLLLRGKAPWTLKHPHEDHASLKPAADMPKSDYPKPDGVLTFDRSSSVFLSNTNHEEDQPVHLRLTDPTVPIEHAELRGHTGWIADVSFSPDGSFVLTGSYDGTARVWKLASGQCVRILSGHDGAVSGVAIGTTRALSVGHDGAVRVWDQQWNQVDLLPGHDRLLGITTNGRVAAYCAADGEAFVLREGRPTALMQHRGQARTALVRGDGMILTAGEDGAVRVYQPEATGATQSLSIPAPAWCVDAQRDIAVVGGDDGFVYVFKEKS